MLITVIQYNSGLPEWQQIFSIPILSSLLLNPKNLHRLSWSLSQPCLLKVISIKIWLFFISTVYDYDHQVWTIICHDDGSSIWHNYSPSHNNRLFHFNKKLGYLFLEKETVKKIKFVVLLSNYSCQLLIIK